MADYNGSEKSVERTQGLKDRSLSAQETGSASFVLGSSEVTRHIRLAAVDAQAIPTPLIYCINRGKNTGMGPTFVYWVSPNEFDPTGAYYDGSVPFEQLTDIVGTGSFVA